MSSVHQASRLSSIHHQDIFMGWGSLVTGLVAVHIFALLLWIILVLVNEKRSNKSEEKKE